MTSQPRVSIILATNRNSPFIEEALATVVGQSCGDWDLTVVDTGVPDAALLRQQVAAVPRSRIVTAAPSTLALARNVGIGASHGELLVFHDDDDVWLPSRLQRQVEALDRTPDAPASWVGGWHMDAAGLRFGPSFSAAPSSAAEMLSGRRNTPRICGTLMVRREACAAVGGFAPELPIMEDFEFMLRPLWHGDFVAVDEELLGYRRHDGNMTNTSAANARVRRQVMRESIDRLLWAAQLRGDTTNGALLAEYLARFTRDSAFSAGVSALRLTRRRDWGDAAREAA